MPSRSDWKNYTPGDIQGLSAFEKKDLFNNLERNYRALKNDRSAAAELPRIERILGFLGAKKDSAGNWSTPDFETAPTETGGDEVYKAARQMEADRRKKMEEEAALERARPADTMSFDALDVFGLTPAAKARQNGPAETMVFEEPIDVFGRMPSAPKSVETAETWKFDPIDVLGRKGFEGPDVEDMPGDENSGFSMSFPPLDIYGGKNPFKEGELEREYDQKVKADADLLKNTTVGEMNPSDVGFRQWLAFQLNPPVASGEVTSEAETEPEVFAQRPTDDLVSSDAADRPDPLSYLYQEQGDIPSNPNLQPSSREDRSPLKTQAKLPPLNEEGLALQKLEGQDPFRAWLKQQGVGSRPTNEGAHSADLRNEMQALIMAKGGMPYSPQTTMRQMANRGSGIAGVKGNLTPGQMLTQKRYEDAKAERGEYRKSRDARDDARIEREREKFERQMQFRQAAEDLKREKFTYDQGEDKADAKRKMMDRANDLSKQFNALPEVKTMTEISRQSENLKAGLSKGTGAGDQAAIMSFNKMMDPGSVVRESEFAASAEGAGVLSRLESLVNFYSGKGRLDDTARKQLQDAANEFERSARKYYQKRLHQYENIADDFEIDPSMRKNIFPTWFGDGSSSSGTAPTAREEELSSGDGKPGIPISTPVVEPEAGSEFAPKAKKVLPKSKVQKKFYNKMTGQPLKEGTSPETIESLRKKGLIEER